MKWYESAACAGMDVNFFYQTGPGTAHAERFCQTCPVINECLEAALAEEAGLKYANIHGVRGGKNAVKRYNLAIDRGLTIGRKKRLTANYKERKCKLCGEPFTPLTSRAIYCSDECRDARVLRRQAEARRKKREEFEQKIQQVKNYTFEKRLSDVTATLAVLEAQANAPWQQKELAKLQHQLTQLLEREGA